MSRKFTGHEVTRASKVAPCSGAVITANEHSYYVVRSLYGVMSLANGSQPPSTVISLVKYNFRLVLLAVKTQCPTVTPLIFLGLYTTDYKLHLPRESGVLSKAPTEGH